MWPFDRNKLRESTPDNERMELIEATAEDAARYLGLRFEKHLPDYIVEKIDRTVVELVFEVPSLIPDTEDAGMLLGALWGTQLVRELDWQWVNLHRGKKLDVGVASETRDKVIYPFTFVEMCLAKQRICTIELSFNMLRERAEEFTFEPRSYESIMEGITHIVPPYELRQTS